jgi:hypothetical protein
MLFCFFVGGRCLILPFYCRTFYNGIEFANRFESTPSWNKKCSRCYYYKLECLEVDNDLNMTFCNLVEDSIYVWDVLVKYDTQCATISTHVSKHQFQNFTNCNITLLTHVRKHQFQNLTNCNITLSISNAYVASLLCVF